MIKLKQFCLHFSLQVFRIRIPNFFSLAKSFSIVLSVIEVFSEIFSEMAFAEILELRDTIFSITI